MENFFLKSLVVLILVFSISLVFAVEDNSEWGDIGDLGVNDSDVQDLPKVSDGSEEDYLEDTVGEDLPLNSEGYLTNSNSPTFYTPNFYMAIGVSIVGLFIVLYIVYSLFRSPKNRWKKK